MKYPDNITEAKNVSTAMKTKPVRIGKCQAIDKATMLASTTAQSRSATSAEARNAEASQSVGGQGLVNTIFRLRLLR
jgi:hypothetical protein